MIPGVKHYLAHHTASEINLCAVAIGVPLLLDTLIRYEARNVLALGSAA